VHPDTTWGTSSALSSWLLVSKETKATDFPFGVNTSMTRPNCEKWRSRTGLSRHDMPPSTPTTNARCCNCPGPGAPAGSAGGASSRKRACSLAPRSRPCSTSARRMSSRPPSLPGMAPRWSGGMPARCGPRELLSGRIPGIAPESRPCCPSRTSRTPSRERSLRASRWSLRCLFTCAVPCASPVFPTSPPSTLAVSAGAASRSWWAIASSSGSYSSSSLAPVDRGRRERGARRGATQRRGGEVLHISL